MSSDVLETMLGPTKRVSRRALFEACMARLLRRPLPLLITFLLLFALIQIAILFHLKPFAWLVSPSIVQTNKKEMNMKPPSNIQTIILFGYFRGGSSFTGDLLRQKTQTYYMYEPLHLIKSHKINASNAEELDLQVGFILDILLRCDPNRAKKYLNWISSGLSSGGFLAYWNEPLWAKCGAQPSTCGSEHINQQVCLIANRRLAKVNRLRMSQLRTLLQHEMPSIHQMVMKYKRKLQLLYLVRDPRAIYSSILVSGLCEQQECERLEYLCGKMQEDILQFGEMWTELTNQKIVTTEDKWRTWNVLGNHSLNVIADTLEKRIELQDILTLGLLRFEELAENPKLRTQLLYERMNLEFDDQVMKFLLQHTELEIVSKKLSVIDWFQNLWKKLQADANPYSTVRKSSDVPARWLRLLNWSQVQQVQDHCALPMRLLGYLPLNEDQFYALREATKNREPILQHLMLS